MRDNHFKVEWIFLLLAFTFSPSNASPSLFPARIRLKRQNDVCRNHTPGEFAKNPDDCRSFFLCMDNGQAVMAPCPPTMLFNPISKLCDTAANVKCDIDMPIDYTNYINNYNNNNNENINNENDNNDNELQNASKYCASQHSDQNRILFVGSSIGCDRYFICYYGKAVLQECGANLHWNANAAKCDLPEKAGCPLWSDNKDTSTNSPSNGSVSYGNTNNEYVGDSQLINCPIYGHHIFPHMSRCEHFIYCVKGYAILQQCPFYYRFDIVSKSCKWRTAAICVQDLNINFRKLVGR
ncbi:probable chitinase 10 [Eurosta solidaginis]|uniref:probable chitinase 10 n=1 Tax=Eurosta solidaginis TaxID=178769 RepID=UPI003530AB9E